MSGRHSADALPAFVAPRDVILPAFEALRPPRRMAVSEWAERHRQLRNPGAYSGPWRNDVAPFLVEVMDRSASRAVEVLAIAGPAQFGKTEVGLNIIGHAVDCNPRDVLAVQYSKDMAIEFADERIDRKLIAPCETLRAKVGEARGDDKVLTKRFTSGMRVVMGWPVAGQLAGRPVPIVWLDERDRMPNDVGGEGDPVELSRKRTTTFGRNALVLATSTPSGLHPDDCGPDSDEASAILLLVLGGDFNILFAPCPHCGEYWSPGFGFDRKPTATHLWWPDGATPEEARKKACLVCPHCGAEIDEAARKGMIAAAVWVPRGMTIDADGALHGGRPMTRTASYWISGLLHPHRTVGQIAEELVAAERIYERTLDESKLKVAWNTALGMPYRPRTAGALPVEVAELDARREDWQPRTVANGVRFLTAAVDVQRRRFAVMVMGWNEAAESWLVDRFDVTHTADGAELDPPNVQAHWRLLLGRAIGAAYPLAGDPGRVLDVASTVIDMGGAAGEDDTGLPTEGVGLQARNFARQLYAGGLPLWRLALIKGASTRTAPMLPGPTWEKDDKGNRRRDAVPFYVIGVHAVKNIVDNRLRLSRPRPDEVKPGYCHFPAEVADGVFDELTAERKVKGWWKKQGPNESWDLAVYNEIARQRLRAERVTDWSRPPAWATPRAAAAEAPAVAAVIAAPARRGRRIRSKGL